MDRLLFFVSPLASGCSALLQESGRFLLGFLSLLFQAGKALGEALPPESRQFNFNHVQPRGMDRSVVPFDLVCDTARCRVGKVK